MSDIVSSAISKEAGTWEVDLKSSIGFGSNFTHSPHTLYSSQLQSDPDMVMLIMWVRGGFTWLGRLDREPGYHCAPGWQRTPRQG